MGRRTCAYSSRRCARSCHVRTHGGMPRSEICPGGVVAWWRGGVVAWWRATVSRNSWRDLRSGSTRVGLFSPNALYPHCQTACPLALVFSEPEQKPPGSGRLCRDSALARCEASGGVAASKGGSQQDGRYRFTELLHRLHFHFTRAKHTASRQWFGAGRGQGEKQPLRESPRCQPLSLLNICSRERYARDGLLDYTARPGSRSTALDYAIATEAAEFTYDRRA
ncbi:hypothetical protein QFZ83_005146 [Variovorax sp. W1I1]|nr:hypothetical protein [Variovorax sp. W1I1]